MPLFEHRPGEKPAQIWSGSPLQCRTRPQELHGCKIERGSAEFLAQSEIRGTAAEERGGWTGKSTVAISFNPALVSRMLHTSWLVIAVGFARPGLPAP